jgi:hypothetical protein
MNKDNLELTSDYCKAIDNNYLTIYVQKICK